MQLNLKVIAIPTKIHLKKNGKQTRTCVLKCSGGLDGGFTGRKDVVGVVTAFG